MTTTCSIDGCPGRVKARGWCSKHYGRWQNHGTTDPLRVRTDATNKLTDEHHTERLALYHQGLPDIAIGQLLGISKQTVTSWRLKANLLTNSPMRGPKRDERFAKRMELWHQGLDESQIAEALGENRRTVVAWRQRQGLESRGPRMAVENHGCWTGEAATYGAVHQRLRSQRGRADAHTCDWCGEPARHWAYDYGDADAKSSEFGWYSTDLSRYQPLCALCHNRGDAAYRKAMALSPNPRREQAS